MNKESQPEPGLLGKDPSDCASWVGAEKKAAPGEDSLNGEKGLSPCLDLFGCFPLGSQGSILRIKSASVKKSLQWMTRWGFAGCGNLCKFCTDLLYAEKLKSYFH